MSTRARFFIPFAAAVCLLSTGCGYISDPLPPSLNVPKNVDDLTARQRGDKLILDFTIPNLTTDGVVMKRLDGIEIRGGPYTGTGWDRDRWAAGAKKIDREAGKPGPMHLELPVDEWAGKTVILGIRVAGPKGKLSGWSNLVSMPVVPPLVPPAGLRAEAVREGVRVEWQMPPARPGLWFHVYRKAPDQKDQLLVGSVEKSPYTDPATEYGKQYEYAVQTIEKVGQVEAESAISAPVLITPRDTFAPAVPAGLAAIAGTDSIQLNWDPDTEPDLKAYRVYRSVEGAAFERVAEVETPHYGDRAVQPGKKYRYAVSAMDQLGNESAQSAPIEVAMQ